MIRLLLRVVSLPRRNVRASRPAVKARNVRMSSSRNPVRQGASLRCGCGAVGYERRLSYELEWSALFELDFWIRVSSLGE